MSFPESRRYVVRLWVVDNNRAEQVTAQTVDRGAEAAGAAELVSGRPDGREGDTHRRSHHALHGRGADRGQGGGPLPRRRMPSPRSDPEGPRRSKPQAKTTRLLRFRRFERRLRARAAVRIFMTKPGTIGKYTSFRIRKGNSPKRRDLCMLPGAKLPSPCPGP